MTFRDLWRPARIAFEGEGAGGAGGGNDTVAGGGNDTVAGGGNDTAAGGAGDKWWKGVEFSTEEQAWLEARGLADEDMTKVVPKLVKGHRNAEIRLGRGVDQILDRPKEGQKVTDWMREQGDMFGLPKTLEDVKIERPADLAEGIAWDSDFETKAKQAAFDLGLSGAQLQGMTALYAEKVQAVLAQADTDAQVANEKMMTTIRSEWGAETDAKIARARQAAGVVAQAAGLDSAGIEAVSQALSLKTGDAATIKMFAALGEMLADDKMVGGGGGQIGTTPAEARAQAAALRAPEGAYYKAVAANDQREIARLKPTLDRLDKIASGGKA